MNGIVTAAQAEIRALTETLRAQSARIAKMESENAHLRAILAHVRTSLNEQVNDPMEDGDANA